MAKRFTDTCKWDKPWFRKLTPIQKCVWLFLCDKCDHAGVWDIDTDHIEHFIGEKYSLESLLKAFGDKVQHVGDKLIIPSFVEFQYSTLKTENRVHKSVLDRLNKVLRNQNKDLSDQNKDLRNENKPLISPFQGAKDTDTETETDKDKELVLEKTLESKNQPESFFVLEWNTKVFSLPKIKRWSKSRVKKSDRLLTQFTKEQWSEACLKVEESDFLSGRNGAWTACCVDWLLNPENFLKVIEGNYQNKYPGQAKRLVL